MKTKRFCELIELAFQQEYGEETQFDTVPYIHDDQGPMVRCLGVFLLPDQHMAVVTARAMQIMSTNEDMVAPLDLDEATDAFVEILHDMRVAPYMQWHCAYFPGLTQEQADAGADAFEGVIDTDSPDGSDDGPPWPFDQLKDEFLNLGITVHRCYSGRGMVGRECLGISGSLQDLQVAWSTVRERAPSLTKAALADFRYDNLGMDTVMYFPDVETPKGDSDA